MSTIKKIGTIEAIGFMIVAMINKLIINDPKRLIDNSRYICVVKYYFHYYYCARYCFNNMQIL